jgi:hypothetical protein
VTLPEWINADKIQNCREINICGLMTNSREEGLVIQPKEERGVIELRLILSYMVCKN